LSFVLERQLFDPTSQLGYLNEWVTLKRRTQK
jgi:hypothetical protein